MSKLFKLIVYVPLEQADKMRQVLAEAGAGHIGNYDSCSFSVRGTGRFRPLKGAKPAVGEIDKLTEVDEERIEVEVEGEILDDVVYKVRKAHPYEEPAIDILEMKHL